MENAVSQPCRARRSLPAIGNERPDELSYWAVHSGQRCLTSGMSSIGKAYF
jgi:hypothetical protein